MAPLPHPLARAPRCKCRARPIRSLGSSHPLQRGRHARTLEHPVAPFVNSLDATPSASTAVACVEGVPSSLAVVRLTMVPCVDHRHPAPVDPRVTRFCVGSPTLNPNDWGARDSEVGSPTLRACHPLVRPDRGRLGVVLSTRLRYGPERPTGRLSRPAGTPPSDAPLRQRSSAEGRRPPRRRRSSWPSGQRAITSPDAVVPPSPDPVDISAGKPVSDLGAPRQLEENPRLGQKTPFSPASSDREKS